MKGVTLQVWTKDGTVTLGQQGHRCRKKDGAFPLESLVNGSDEHLGLPGAGLPQEDAELAPGRILLAITVNTVVQEGLALRQAVHDILEDGPLQWRQRVKALDRPCLKAADACVDYAALPQV